jgi:uncharacterized repeat protein (TIGR02543 family)
MHAQWRAEGETPPAQYTLTFDSHGGSAAAAITADAGTAVSKPADPTRSGYTFTGWFSAETGGTLYPWPHTLTAGITMHAQWQTEGETPPVQYTLTFNSHGGSAAAAITADAGTAVSNPEDPTRSGYTVTGWFSAETGGTLYPWPHSLSASITMHAQWQAAGETPTAQYTLTFDSHGGSAVAAITADAGTAVSKPVDPSRSGYTFTGWFSAETGGTLYPWPHALNADVTIHAQWTPLPYSVTYTLNGGTSATNPVTSYTVESPALTLAAPSRTGYAFVGWYDNADLTGTPVTAILAGSTGDKAFWARWTLIYSVTYTLNGGTNAANPVTSYTVESPDLTLAEPTRPNYTFVGWYDNAGFNGTPVTVIPAGSTGDKAFWARWTISPVDQGITLTIEDFIDPADAAEDTSVTLTKPGGTETLSVSGSDDDTQAAWYMGLVKIGTGSSVSLSADALSLGTHTLRVTALYGGVRHSKEITVTVEQ